MSTNLLTHKALAELLGVSETTVKSYRRKFPGCFPVANQGKPIRFGPEAAQVALRIREYFALGMSVPDARSRLLGEFPWMSPQNTSSVASPAPLVSGGQAMPLQKKEPRDLTFTVSSMAKSLVAMSAQQSTILQRLKNMEAFLEDAGLTALSRDQLDKRRMAIQEKEQRLERRLEHLDRATGDLAKQTAFLLERLQRPPFVESDQGGRLETPVPGMQEEPTERAQVFRMDVPSAEHIQGALSHDEVLETEQPGHVEPPRQFQVLPLVVQHPDGRYLGVGGKNRGRFCLDDLKAMLAAYGFESPSRYALRYEPDGRNWRLLLVQPEMENAKELDLVLQERLTKSGLALVEIVQLKIGGHSVHPSEISAFIDSLYA